jgi:hypothetical protein
VKEIKLKIAQLKTESQQQTPITIELTNDNIIDDKCVTVLVDSAEETKVKNAKRFTCVKCVKQ